MQLRQNHHAHLLKSESKTAHRPKELLTELFSDLNLDPELKTLNVLVPGAGSFPSYDKFVKEARSKFKRLKEINFCLVEPAKEDIASFMKHRTRDASINIEAALTDLMSFLETFSKNYPAHKFHIAYFEHPQIGALIFQSYDHISIAIPYLQQVMHPKCAIMGICKSYHERNQFKQFLNYSFDIKSQVFTAVTNPLRRFINLIDPIDFSHGIVGRINRLPNLYQIKKRSEQLDLDRLLLKIFTVLSFIIYFKTNTKSYASHFSVSVPLLQIGFHKPGLSGFGLKVGLCVAQLILCYLGLPQNDEQLGRDFRP